MNKEPLVTTTVDSSSPPSPIEQLRSQAMACANQGRCGEARQLLESALARDPTKKVELLNDMAAVALRGGDLVQAIQLSRHILAAVPQDDSARFTLAMSLVGIGSHGEALELLDALSQAPGFHANMPELAALVTTEAARLRSLRPASAARPADMSGAGSTAKVDGHAGVSARQFIWGICDPFAQLPQRQSPDGVGGWYSDHPVFEELIRTRRPKRLVEVGSLLGASAIHIATMLQHHNVEGELTCVDTFLGSREHFFDMRDQRDAMLAAGRYHFFDEFLGNVAQAGCSQIVTPFPQSSTTAARIFREAGRKFDFIYLDASHEYRDVLSDLREWWPLVDAGGVLVGDDFEDPWFGVIRAASEFSDEIGQPLKLHRAFASSPIGGRENTKFMLSR